MDSIILFIIAASGFTWTLVAMLKRPTETLIEEDEDEETIEEFFDRMSRNREEIDKKREEFMIELSIERHRLNKLKSPKPKWIQ